MKLYHGTSERFLTSILKNGIVPRKFKKKGNWQHTIKSNPHTVYLSDAYALYFAFCACKKDERLLIIEVDTDRLDHKLFRPDEDALAQAYCHSNKDKDLDLLAVTEIYRENIDEYKNIWAASLKSMGTCGYKGEIPVSAISKYACLPQNHPMAITAMDPTITILNYHFCGARYKAITQWALGYDVEPRQIFDFMREDLKTDHKIIGLPSLQEVISLLSQKPEITKLEAQHV